MLYTCPITLKQASRVVTRWHRHHRAPHGALFAIAACSAGELVGVAVVGRPVARHLQDGWTCEVVRCCTDGTKNACSLLYGASWRAAKGLGYRRIITYTLPSEGGASLRAVGWRAIENQGGGSWDRKSRPRQDKHPTEIKTRWEITSSGHLKYTLPEFKKPVPPTQDSLF